MGIIHYHMMEENSEERLSLELELLRSMYPGLVQYESKARDVSFSSTEGSADKLVLRLPSTYPEHGFPEVISARGSSGTDLRAAMKAIVQQTCQENQEGEMLDALLIKYTEMQDSISGQEVLPEAAEELPETQDRKKTVVIWLHHLLATSKRKLAIQPSSMADQVRGVTKPGYPGVMVFTGTQAAVDDHVAELKSQNWQAFAVRYEDNEEWRLHSGISEVETMSEVVQCIEEHRREAFLKAVGVK